MVPLPAAHLGVSVFGLMSIEQNKPGSVTVPLKPRVEKPTQRMLLTGVSRKSVLDCDKVSRERVYEL